MCNGTGHAMSVWGGGGGPGTIFVISSIIENLSTPRREIRPCVEKISPPCVEKLLQESLDPASRALHPASEFSTLRQKITPRISRPCVESSPPCVGVLDPASRVLDPASRVLHPASRGYYFCYKRRAIRSRFARGAVEVCSKYGRGSLAKVHRGTVKVRSSYL